MDLSLPSRSTPPSCAVASTPASGGGAAPADGVRRGPPRGLLDGFELSGSFVTYLGWLYTYGTPLTLVGSSEEQVADARRELVRIGVDDLAGMAVGDIETLAAGAPLRSYRVSDFAGLRAALVEGAVQVVDTRRDEESAAGHVDGAIHIPLHQLADRLDEVGPGDVWVYCGSGYRASVAASVLDRPGRDVILVNDSYANAQAAGLEGGRPAAMARG